MHKWYRKYWNSDIKTYTTPDNDTPEDCPHGGRRFARTGDRAPERRTDRGGARPHEIRHHGHRPPTTATGTTQPPTDASGRSTRTIFSLTVEDERKAFDYALIIIHGTPGEDGKLQGYLDMMGVPYSSCSMTSSVITFDKITTKRTVAGQGYQPRPRDFPPQGRNGRPGQGGRGVRTAALHQAQRQRQLVSA